MAEPLAKAKGPRIKELQNSYKSSVESVSRHRNELELPGGAEHSQPLSSQTAWMKGGSILNSPLHPTTPISNSVFVSDFEGSSRSLLQSPDIITNKRLSSMATEGGYFDSSFNAASRRIPEPITQPPEESHKIIHVKNSSQDQDDKPSPKLYLQFTGLTYTVCERQSRWQRCKGALFPSLKGNKPKPLHLLNDISGDARDGELLAVMGPSGSGKSTLIDALAHRIYAVKGTMTLNGKPCSERLLRNISAYVMQVWTPALTGLGLKKRPPPPRHWLA